MSSPPLPLELVDTLRPLVEKAPRLRALLSPLETPFYLFDPVATATCVTSYLATFHRLLHKHRAFYAMKSNPHPLVLRTMTAHGLGMDASSPEEVKAAVEAGAQQVIFSGPGKTEAHLEAALELCRNLIVHADSRGELQRISAVGQRLGRSIQTGFRLYLPTGEEWSRFGEKLSELPELYRFASRLPGITPMGIQHHRSHRLDARGDWDFLEALHQVLLRDMTGEERAALRVVDLGGGLKPAGLERAYAEDAFACLTAQDSVVRPPLNEKGAPPPDVYARTLADAVCRFVTPLLDCQIFTEPGRVLSAPSMHFVMRVVDKKSKTLAVVDGGTHMIGWERYLYVFCPIVNLSRPGMEEHPIRIAGSLCDPEDFVGFSYFGEGLEEGDLLLMPNQGAYTYSTAQRFIRPIPVVHTLPEG